MRTRSIVDDAGVPYTFKRVLRPGERTIAERAISDQADIALVDGTARYSCSEVRKTSSRAS